MKKHGEYNSVDPRSYPRGSASKINSLKNHHKKHLPQIKSRLQDFKNVWKKSDRFLFQEICFCNFAVQTKSKLSDQAVKLLLQKKLLYEGNAGEIAKIIRPIIRFHNNKADWIVHNRHFFRQNGKFKIKKWVNPDDIVETRSWFQKNVKGFGFKEASHFLRNIGFGEKLAILDVHVLRHMRDLKLIRQLPNGLTPKKYLQYEAKLKQFSSEIDIPLDELDLVFWSFNTGEILK